MAKSDPEGDAAARQARADAIRRARDLHNAGLGPPADETPESEATTDSGAGPNYVDLIDRKMREMDED